MAHIDIAVHSPYIASRVEVIDLETNRFVWYCVAVNTEEGWIEIAKHGSRRVRREGKYEVRDIKTGQVIDRVEGNTIHHKKDEP